MLDSGVSKEGWSDFVATVCIYSYYNYFMYINQMLQKA